MEHTDTPVEKTNTHGWKTYLAALAAMTAGAVALVNGDVVHGLQGVIGGFALIGLRGAAAKLIAIFQKLLQAAKEG